VRILITNDDGINAEGLEVLRRVAHQFSDDVWVVAPESNQSGVSHALSLTQPLRVREVEDKVFAVNGTPTDCVIIAVRQIMDKRPDLILSGVNAGQNIADHITYSGTVAGALEGAILGIRSIAFSQAHDWSKGPHPIDWSVSIAKIPEVLEKLIAVDMPASTFLNVNFPIKLADDENQISISRQAHRMHGLAIEDRIDGVGRPYYWLKFEETTHEVCDSTDISALEFGKISITPVKVDMTDHAMMQKLEQALL
jgi:5'-nucleotidase